jgi:hypothetical protein
MFYKDSGKNLKIQNICKISWPNQAYTFNQVGERHAYIAGSVVYVFSVLIRLFFLIIDR